MLPKTQTAEYGAFNRQVFAAVPQSAVSILDIGCGTGAMGKALLLANPGRQLTGVTYSAREAEKAGAYYQQVYVEDLNALATAVTGNFDCILFSHVLEHTQWPAMVLRHYAEKLKPGGTIVVALPNVLFFKQRWQFMRGRFRYSPYGGLMDETHFRFFDRRTAAKLLEEAGLKVVSSRGYGAFPQPVWRSLFPRAAAATDAWACRWFPGLFAFQFVFTATIPR